MVRGRSLASTLLPKFILTGSLKTKQDNNRRSEADEAVTLRGGHFLSQRFVSGYARTASFSMLSRKGSCAGTMSAAAVVDRTRVGERLQAALAGLQELHLLKDRQSEMVSWALRVDREEPVTSVHADPEAAKGMGAEEQRLEATLTALKQQLV